MKTNVHASSHKFSEVPRAEIPRSRFDRTHSVGTTMDAGDLVPFLVDEILPGDTYNGSARFFGRLQSLVHPLMDSLWLDWFFFFVPTRLLWSNFQKFHGEQTNPGDSTSYLVPVVTVPGGGFAVHSLYDYMGIPPGIVPTTTHPSALPLRAYNLIFNEWFRDQNILNSRPKNMGDGPDAATDYVLLKRYKRHDYFTSVLPWPQKGGAVSLFAAGAQAKVVGLGTENQVFGVAGASVWETGAGAGIAYPFSRKVDPASANTSLHVRGSAAAGGTPLIFADLQSATGSSINELRQAFQIQRLLERDARGGTRYTEIIRAHFGVVSPDARLQRPEYLGGGSAPVMVSPVAQTTTSPAVPTNKDSQGNLAGVATVSGEGGGFVKSFTEHGWLIGIVNLRGQQTYSQGVERHWWKRTRYETYYPALSHLGEQTVLRREIWWAAADGLGGNDTVFGYQERYAEYRYKQSQWTGLFRVDAAGSLSVWHLSQDFAAAPIFDTNFLIESPPLDRCVVVPTEPHMMLHGQVRLITARPMPLYGVPGFIDHF